MNKKVIYTTTVVLALIVIRSIHDLLEKLANDHGGIKMASQETQLEMENCEVTVCSTVKGKGKWPKDQINFKEEQIMELKVKEDYPKGIVVFNNQYYSFCRPMAHGPEG